MERDDWQCNETCNGVIEYGSEYLDFRGLNNDCVIWSSFEFLYVLSCTLNHVIRPTNLQVWLKPKGPFQVDFDPKS